jgi:hypothetical protein
MANSFDKLGLICNGRFVGMVTSYEGGEWMIFFDAFSRACSSEFTNRARLRFWIGMRAISLVMSMKPLLSSKHRCYYNRQNVSDRNEAAAAFESSDTAHD